MHLAKAECALSIISSLWIYNQHKWVHMNMKEPCGNCYGFIIFRSFNKSNPKVYQIPEEISENGCDGWPYLLAWLDPESTKTQRWWAHFRGIFLIRLLEVGRPSLNVDSTFWWQHRQKDMEERLCFLPVYLTLLESSLIFTAIAFLCWY